MYRKAQKSIICVLPSCWLKQDPFLQHLTSPGLKIDAPQQSFSRAAGETHCNLRLQHHHLVVKKRSRRNHCWHLSSIAPTASAQKMKILQEFELSDILFIHFPGWELLWAMWKGRAWHQSFSCSVIWAWCMLLSHPSLFYPQLLTPFPSWSCHKHFFSSSVVNWSVLKIHGLLLFMHQQRYLCQDKESYGKVPFLLVLFHTYIYTAILLKNYNSELNFRKEK